MAPTPVYSTSGPPEHLLNKQQLKKFARSLAFQIKDLEETAIRTPAARKIIRGRGVMHEDLYDASALINLHRKLNTE